MSDALEPALPDQFGLWVGGSEAKQVSILAGDHLYIAEGLKGKAVKQGIAALQQGAHPSEAFKKTKAIPLAAITSIDTADHLTAVNLRYREDGKEKKEAILADDDAQRLDALERMAAALGPNVQRTVQPLPVGQAMVGPSIALAATVGGTAVLYFAAADIEPGEEYNPTGRRAGMKRLLHWLLETIGPTGVIVIGVLALLASAFWMYRRITSPPQQTIVARTG